ncbi:MAG TPA: M23 family metallopeptidase [Leptospiraceae bacterium]|nr:M23 family metallopeptidase [Leptospiraceae bacterium]
MELSGNKLTLLERMTLKYYRLQKSFQKLHIFGKTKVSLLLIPHSNENIVKVEISHYSLGFLALLITSLFIMGISFLGYYIYTRNDHVDLYSRGNTEKVFFLHHDLMGDILEDTIEDLASETEDLNKVTWERSLRDSKAKEELGLMQETAEKANINPETELDSNMKIFIYTVEKFANVYESLSTLKANFQNSMDYLETRESIFESMPRGRPLGPGVGLITSTYGHREDPFYVDVGEFHNGIDFASANGTPIYATAPGIVADASGSDGGLGLHVRINHENGFFTMYGHCSKLLVAEGDVVKQGDIIALVGSTGKATGSHLHYEVHIGLDPPINPQEFINID